MYPLLAWDTERCTCVCPPSAGIIVCHHDQHKTTLDFMTAMAGMPVSQRSTTQGLPVARADLKLQAVLLPQPPEYQETMAGPCPLLTLSEKSEKTVSQDRSRQWSVMVALEAA